MIGFAFALTIYSVEPAYVDPYVEIPYDTRQLAHPYNPGPKIIIVPPEQRKPQRKDQDDKDNR